ncbi:MAG: hypothetical protein R6U10_03535 [Thermoplasmatota archaeon]
MEANMYKKMLSMTVTLCLVFLAVPITEGVSEETMEHTVTFATYLPDGSVEYVEQEVELADGESLSAVIADRCAEMVEDDNRFQQHMDQQIGLYLIISGGSGLHMALPPALLEVSLLRISLSLMPSIVYCSYSGEEASTTITPLTGDGNVTSYDGPHKLLTAGFIGVIGWSGVFSFASTGFAGLTMFTWTSAGEV